MSYLEGHLCLSVDDLLASLALHPLAIRVTHQVIDLKQESVMMVKLQIKLHSLCSQEQILEEEHSDKVLC